MTMDGGSSRMRKKLMERRRHRTMERGPSRKREKKKGKLISWQRKRELERETEKKILEIPNPPDFFFPASEQSTTEVVGEVSDDRGEAESVVNVSLLALLSVEDHDRGAGEDSVSVEVFLEDGGEGNDIDSALQVSVEEWGTASVLVGEGPVEGWVEGSDSKLLGEGTDCELVGEVPVEGRVECSDCELVGEVPVEGRVECSDTELVGVGTASVLVGEVSVEGWIEGLDSVWVSSRCVLVGEVSMVGGVEGTDNELVGEVPVEQWVEGTDSELVGEVSEDRGEAESVVDVSLIPHVSVEDHDHRAGKDSESVEVLLEDRGEGNDIDSAVQVSVDYSGKGMDTESVVEIYLEDRRESKDIKEETLDLSPSEEEGPTTKEMHQDVCESEEEGVMKESTKWGASFDKLLEDLGLVEDDLAQGLRAEWYRTFVSILNKFGRVEEEVSDYVLAIYWGYQKERLVNSRSVVDHGGAKLEETIEVEGEAEMVEEDEDSTEIDYGHVCTIFSDFLSGIASIPGHGPDWDRTIYRKAFFAFRKCNKDGVITSCELTGEDAAIDLRGRYVDDAVKMFIKDLYFFSGLQPIIKRLFVIVGCMKHGCGQGILKNAITEVLDRDKTIPVDYFDCDGSTICITLGKTDFSHIGWTLAA